MMGPRERARAKARAVVDARGLTSPSVAPAQSTPNTSGDETGAAPTRRRPRVLRRLLIANAAVLVLLLGGSWVWSHMAGEGGGPMAWLRSATNIVPVAKAPPTADEIYQSDVKPLLEQYCYRCHGPEKHKAKLNLAEFGDVKSIQAKRKLWHNLFNMLHTREMPPEEKPQPTAEERDRITAWLEGVLNSYDLNGPIDPGRVTIRRLNRNEYNNTIRDLLAVDFRPADDFPSDDVGYGFDNIGDVLSLPPLLMEKYLDAAEQALSKAIVEKPNPESPTRRYSPGQMRAEGGASADGSSATMYSTSEVFTNHNFPASGKYTIRITAWANQAGDEPAKAEIRIDGKGVKVHEVKATQKKPGNYETTVHVDKGNRRLAVAFINDYYDPQNPDPNRRDRNLYLHSVEVTGPIDAAPPTLPESHTRIFIAYPSQELPKRDAARRVIGRFATRAFRRPVGDDEIKDFMTLYDLAEQHGETYEASVKLALEGVLTSPNFLFRAEPDRPTDDPDGVYPLNDYEVASRLSYFIWSSMPDEELFSLASQGKLRDPAVIEQQVLRMLKDKKAMALVDNFAGQWLQLRRLPEMAPDDKAFPQYDDKLAQAMEKEAKMFFASVMLEDRPITQLLDADYTYLNEPLAKLYGVPGVTGDEMRRVELPDRRRGGVLTMGAVLTVTSNPTRTSPVLRGKYVLENILGTPPPPPPPDVGNLKEIKDPTLSLRERMEMHRQDPNCASCHRRMDPIGFGLENYNGIGQWREKDGQATIDPSGTLPDGATFAGPADLKRLLASREQEVARCFAEKMLTYALGRGVEDYDMHAVRDITLGMKRDDYRFSRLMIEIAQSKPFLYQRNLNADEVNDEQ
ncbi:MAG: DUF1592 domain-containing protein [Phycisphaera sp.]|nr:DUF1592 domain-containing protein [Phycisphaera sp.]